MVTGWIGHGMPVLRRCSNGGLALVVVLWLLVLVSMMAMSFVGEMRDNVRVNHYQRGKQQAYYLAQAGIYHSIAVLVQNDPAYHWPVNSETKTVEYALGSVRLQVQDEQGKVDLNYASEAQLLTVLQSRGVDAQRCRTLVAAIMDWRDRDSLKRLDGAEDDDYAAAGVAYRAGDRPFAHVSELKQVLGMDQQLYLNLKDIVTVYSKSPAVNVSVLAPGLAAVKQQLSPNGSAAFADARLVASIYFSNIGRTFSITALASSNSGALAGIRALVKIKAGEPQLMPFQILDWELLSVECGAASSSGLVWRCTNGV